MIDQYEFQQISVYGSDNPQIVGKRMDTPHKYMSSHDLCVSKIEC